MSNLDDYKKERQELIEARKMKANVPDAELERRDDSDVRIIPKTFKEKWINYWYHYKWATIGGLAAIALIVSFVWSLTHQAVYDTSLSIVTAFPFDGVLESLHETFDPYVKDFTGDGKAELQLAYYSVADPTAENAQVDAQMQMAHQMKLMAQLSIGEDFVFLMDDAGYRLVHDQMGAVFEELSVYTDSANVDGDKYRLNGTNLIREMGLGDWESPLYLCFMDFSVYDERTREKEDLKQRHEASLDFFQALLRVG